MKHEIHVQARAIIIKDKSILLCKTTGQGTNFYFLPGGHVEHWEGARVTLQRELLEETGMQFQVSRFLGCLEYSFDPEKIVHAKCHTHEYDLIFEATSDDLPSTGQSLIQVEPHIEVVWIPMDQLSQIDLRPNTLVGLIPRWLGSDLDEAFQSKMI